jgi:hypothetical protein
MAKIPCFLCSHELRQRRDKNEKPYFICDPCGMQIFVRGRQGIENLSQLIVMLKERNFPFREHARTLHAIQAVLTEIRGVKKEIKAIEDEFVLSDKDNEDNERILKPLKARFANLLSQLDRIARSGR